MKQIESVADAFRAIEKGLEYLELPGIPDDHGAGPVPSVGVGFRRADGRTGFFSLSTEQGLVGDPPRVLTKVSASLLPIHFPHEVEKVQWVEIGVFIDEKRKPPLPLDDPTPLHDPTPPPPLVCEDCCDSGLNPAGQRCEKCGFYLKVPEELVDGEHWILLKLPLTEEAAQSLGSMISQWAVENPEEEVELDLGVVRFIHAEAEALPEI